MRQRKPPQHSTAPRRQPNPHLAPVFGTGMPLDRAGALHPVHQFDRAVMLDEEPGRDFTDGRLDAFRQTVDGQHQLMLLRLDPVLFGRGFAEMQETSNLAPEFRQVAVSLY